VESAASRDRDGHRELPRAGAQSSTSMASGAIGRIIQQVHATLRAARECHTPTLLF
jgi:hypothetical protein